MTATYIDIKTAAKIIREELKKAFPGTKFSVRMHTYSMGSHVSVHYTDGPSVRAVEAVTDQFYGRGFDGMTDSTTWHDTTYKGQAVHFAGSRPSVSRNYTGEPKQEIEAILRAQWTPNTGSDYGDREEISDTARHILYNLDFRFETFERGVAKFLYQGLRTW